MKHSYLVSTPDYLKIESDLYKDFYFSYPVHHNSPLNVEKSVECDRQRSFSTFSFKENDYDIAIESGYTIHVDNSGKAHFKQIELPTISEELIKTILFEIYDLPDDMKKIFIINETNLDTIILFIQLFLGAKGFNYTTKQIIKSLFRLCRTRYYVKRHELKTWRYLPFFAMLGAPNYEKLYHE
ncbi:hypothetical protein H4684_003399 [Desulfomicrobium macestii]|uniref:Uncharacterized protein n=1 Tax=Desulfomicrobium macestii TaxID=90731 RepID=A0ABR9H7N7_9BACT|nr:hypothetical protein [Desulfomicrobium macestii]MBE1426731.1 hypothetical protein [Desulfomicrobium macestii]